MEQIDPTARSNTATPSHNVAHITDDSSSSSNTDNNIHRSSICETTNDTTENDRISPAPPRLKATGPSPPIAASKQYPAPFSGFASEPKPSPSNTNFEEYEPGSNSFPSLRFPRPLGNRQLTNWVSSSSPDIMRPGTISEDDNVSLSELGYDVITTDGESQAESTTSSTDYQRPDDIQSFVDTDTGTDVCSAEADTDSSEDEVESEHTLDDQARYPTESWVVHGNELSDLAQEEVDYDDQANQSLEIPTSFGDQQTPIINQNFPSKQAVDEAPPQIPSIQTMNEKEGSQMRQPSPAMAGKERQHHGWIARAPLLVHAAIDLIRKHRNSLLMNISGLLGLLCVIMAGQYFYQGPIAHELATVPVASVSSGGPLLVTTSVSSVLSPSPVLETSGTSDITKPKTTDSLLSQPARCSAERFGRNEILIRVNQGIKTSWMAKDALLIAVSRSQYDVPTLVSSVDEGILLKLPANEAYGTLDVTVATTRKPKIQEFYQVNFGGRFVFDEAFDAGRQLVRDFAQRFVDTVNTTAWGEEASLPGFDMISKQVCSQTASVSDSILQRVGDFSGGLASTSALVAARLRDRAQMSLKKEPITKRALQLQLELQRQLDDATAGLRLRVLTAQLTSRLWWLRVLGKHDEAQDYLAKAEVFYQEQQRSAWAAQRERAVRIKETIQSMWAPKHPEPNHLWRKGPGRL